MTKKIKYAKLEGGRQMTPLHSTRGYWIRSDGLVLDLKRAKTTRKGYLPDIAPIVRNKRIINSLKARKDKYNLNVYIK